MVIPDRKCAGLPGKPCNEIFAPRNGGHERCSVCGREWRLARQRKYSRDNRHRKKKDTRKPDALRDIDDSPYEIIGAYRMLKLMQRMADL